MIFGILAIAELSDRVVLCIGQQEHQLPGTMGIVGIGMIDRHREPRDNSQRLGVSPIASNPMVSSDFNLK
jgi:hypothetical protein